MRTDPGITFRQRLQPKLLIPIVTALLLAIGTSAFVSGSVLIESLRDASQEVCSELTSNLAHQVEIHRDLDFRNAEGLTEQLRDAQNLSHKILSIAVYERIKGQQRFELFASSDQALTRELAPPHRVPWMIDGAVELERLDAKEDSAIRVSMPILIEGDSLALGTGPEVAGAIALTYSLADVDRQTSDYIKLLLGITGLLMGCAIWVTNRISHRVLSPLGNIQTALEQITGGDLDQQVEVTSKDELGMMASKFNTLVVTLRHNQRELAHHAELLENRVEERTSELREALHELQTLDRAKDAFLSSISHEMRTPLTSIIASAEIIECFGDGDSDSRGEFLGVISSEAQRLMEIIGTIIDLAKLEADSVDFELADYDMRDLATQVLESFTPRAHDQRIVINSTWPDEPVPVFCDAGRIRQVIHRLLDNALNFSPPGGIIHLWIKKDYIMANLYISDEGPGVPPSQRKLIFQKFGQSGGDVLTDKPQGVGLGLTVARNIAEAHRGQLEYEDLEDKGACFVLRLPVLLDKPTPALALENQDYEPSCE